MNPRVRKPLAHWRRAMGNRELARARFELARAKHSSAAFFKGFALYDSLTLVLADKWEFHFQGRIFASNFTLSYREQDSIDGKVYSIYFPVETHPLIARSIGAEDWEGQAIRKYFTEPASFTQEVSSLLEQTLSFYINPLDAILVSNAIADRIQEWRKRCLAIVRATDLLPGTIARSVYHDELKESLEELSLDVRTLLKDSQGEVRQISLEEDRS